MRLFLLALAMMVGFAVRGESAGTGGFIRADALEVSQPGPALAADLLETNAPVRLVREDAPVPGWRVMVDGGTVGWIASTWEISGSTGYSGRPLDVLVAVNAEAVLTGARLMRHNEPILTLGISDEDITGFVGGFAGVDLKARHAAAFTSDADLPDVIARATVSTGVIRDSILRTARTVALGHGLIAASDGVDRVTFDKASWTELAAEGALAHRFVSMDEAHDALKDGKYAPDPGDGPFLDLWVALIDPPTIGRNLLGQQAYTAAIGHLGLGDSALFIASSGLHSHRGTGWRKDGVFDRLLVRQDETVLTPTADDYLRIDRLALPDAPDFKERSVFRLRAGTIDPARPFSVEVIARRDGVDGPVEMAIPATFDLPSRFRVETTEPAPLWVEIWDRKQAQVAGVAVMLVALTLILLGQESVVARPRLYRVARLGFLSVTLFWLGWGINGQLSVVQVVAFLQSLLSGFRWETFLIEPVIFLLWGFVALGLLFWGRGVYCGWLCPFGALQELTNKAARALKVPQVAVPQALHERLWILKYTLFVGILGLSFYSMEQALILAEAEPFKTAISLRMLRAWPFVAFVLLLLAAGLFIERFYCRYLCPLGAALAIPAKLKIFDWLHRRPQCGRECHLCEPSCTVGAIDRLGRINPNECILCLKCQWILHDETQCTILKKRARARAANARAPS